MIVQCPNCKTTYNFEDEMIKPEGVKAKCTVCEHVFVVAPESDVSEQQAEPEEAAGVAEPEAAGPEEVPEAEPEEAAAPEEEEAAEPEEAPEGPEEEPEEEPLGGGMSLDLDEAPKKKKKKKKSAVRGEGGKKKVVVAAVLALVLLVGGGAAGIYFFAPELIPGMTGSADRTEDEEDGGPAAAESGEESRTGEGSGGQASALPDVQNIVLSDIRQYYVDNDKAGRVFVVEGKAVNDFDKTKERIQIEVSLLNAQGEILTSKAFPAGNTLDLYGLQNLSREKIEAGLSDDVGVASRNANVEPGQSVPFMAVFFDPPAGVREFMVKVTGVRDPA